MTLGAPQATTIQAAIADTPATGLSSTALAAPAGAIYGWEMFIAFSAAVVGISVVVAVLALVGSWAMLGVVMLVHFAVTAAMMKLVLGAFGSEEHAYPDMHQAEAASRAAIARRASAPRTASARLAVEL